MDKTISETVKVCDVEVRVPHSPIKAIRLKCLDCSAGQPSEVGLCPVVDCPLWNFRLGKNPFAKKRVLTEERRLAAVARLENYRVEQRDKIAHS